MLFAALLLIQWVTLTIGATAPHFPRKEIHLLIPVESHSTREHSKIRPLIFRDSPDARFRRPIKIPFIRKEIKGTLSLANPPLRNAGSKSRSGREVMNSTEEFHSLLSGKHIPNPTNMNDSSSGNMKHTDKTKRPSQDQEKGEKDRISSLFKDGHSKNLTHTTKYFTNDSELFFTQEPKLSLKYEKEKDEKIIFHKDMHIDKIDTMLEESGKINESLGADNYHKKMHITTDYTNDQEIAMPETFSFTTLPTNQENGNENFENSKISQLNYTEIPNVLKTESKITNEERKNYTTTVFPIKLTQKPRSKMNNHRKTKEFFNPPLAEIDKRINKTSNVSLRTPMLQDGSYQMLTSEATIFSEKSWFQKEIAKLRNEGNVNERTELFIKTSTSNTIVSTPLTTPDSHMNDPPFRGPNVPQEIENFYKEDEKTKMGYHKPTVIETPSFVLMYLGEEWKPSIQILGITWNCHYYVIGSFFALIALYSFISLLRVNTFITLLNIGYYIVINSIILFLCLLRALFLFYDPYNLSGKYPTMAASILLKITLVCLTSSFLLLQLAFINSTKTDFLSPKFKNPCVIALIIVFTYLLYFSLEIAVGVFKAPFILLLTGYNLLALWAIISSISYFCVFRRLHHKALRKQGEMIRLTFTKMHIDGAQLPKKLPKPTLGLSVKLLLFCAILQIFLCICIGVAIFQFFLPSHVQKDPWIWWWYQLICRVLELLITATMSFIATQPQKHFEIGHNRFCSILMWFPCSSFAECFKKEEIVDFEAHSDNYANPQGLRSTGFNLAANSRRLQTNSLPTFRTPLTDVDKNIPVRTLPCSGRHNNHASAISLLSYYRSKRTLSVSTNDGLEDLERTLCNQTTSSSDGRNNTLRQASMLYKDNGFIRFRRETDPEQPMEMSDEDDHIQEDVDTSLEDAESTKANVGSSFHSLLEGDIVQNTLSPFFQIGYKRRFRKMSRVSIETTDYSADVSSDQLSNVVNLRSGLSTSALDFNTRKYGSTCSSESAANSFDVTFFLNSNSSPEMQTSPTSTTPASLNVCSAYRSETEDDKTSSVEGHEVMLRSVSPIVKRASSGRLSLNLNLHTAAEINHSNGHVNVACGTEDITPDSAVYLDLQLSRENTMSPKLPKTSFPSNFDASPRYSPSGSFTKSTDGIMPISPETVSVQHSPSISPTSQSLGELRTSNSYVLMPKSKKNSRGLLYKLRGSTFSLNAAIYGYEPLEQVEHPKACFNENSKKRLERSSSDRRPLSEGQCDDQPQMTPLGEFRNRTTDTGSGFLGDSGLLGDCGVALVDVASQTDDIDINECTHKTCKLLTKNSPVADPSSHIYTPLVDIRK